MKLKTYIVETKAYWRIKLSKKPIGELNLHSGQKSLSAN